MAARARGQVRSGASGDAPALLYFAVEIRFSERADSSILYLQLVFGLLKRSDPWVSTPG